ncbi:hypothetical protein GGI35DRAFT_472581 [Trichoderma velutinum]
MEPTLHKLDANGDTLLTLSNSNQLFVTYYPSWKSALPQHDALKEWQLWTIPTGSTKKSTTGSIQMQLSLKHLQLAWLCIFCFCQRWNEEAFLTVMRIVHAQTTTLPQIVNLEMLAKIAVIVDFY